MKIYRVSRRYYNFLLIGFVLITVFSLLFILGTVIGLIKTVPPTRILQLIPLLLVIPIVWFIWLRQFYTVTIQDNGLVTFYSPVRKVTITLSDIKSIVLLRSSSHILATAVIEVDYAGGKIYMPGYIDNLFDFLDTIESMNPLIEIKGFERF